jgi:hypothetical protein
MRCLYFWGDDATGPQVFIPAIVALVAGIESWAQFDQVAMLSCRNLCTHYTELS